MISIVTTTYNSEEFIQRLYESLVRQIDKEYEWVIVDDLSKDGTLDMLVQMLPPGTMGINIFQMPFNSGGALATSVGIIKAKGSIVVKIDHDDELMPDAIRRIRENFETIRNNSQVAGILFPSIQSEDNKMISSLRKDQLFKYSELVRKEKVTTDGLLALKENIARRYYSLPERSKISLSRVTLLDISKDYLFKYAGGKPLMIYHRDNPESVTLAPKVSEKTIFSYARILDYHDKNYYVKPVHWIRHTLALFHFSIAYYGSPFPIFQYLQRRSTKAWCFFLTPVGFVAHYLKGKVDIVNYEEADPIWCASAARAISRDISVLHD